MRNCWISRAISAMRGINRRVRGIKEEAKGVANRAAYHVASAMEATFAVRRRVGQRPPDHGKVASFSRVPGPSPGNSGHDPGQDRPNSAEILGIGAIAPIDLDRVRSRGYSFQEEILYWCRRVGCRMGETPILFENRRAGVSKINQREVVAALRIILQLGIERLL